MTERARLRTSGSQTPSKLWYEFHNYGPGTSPNPQTGTVDVGCHAGTIKSMFDIVTKGFRKSSDPSNWVSHPMSITSLYAKASSGSSTTRNVPDNQGRGLERTWSGDGVGYIFGALVPVAGSYSFGSYPDLVDIDRLKQLAIIDCANRINPAAALTGVTVAEGKRTVNMILSRARKLAEAWVACRKGDVHKLKGMFPHVSTKKYPKRIVVWDEHGSPVVRKNGRLVRRYSVAPCPPSGPKDPAHKLWLEYRYGWSVLVYDIINLLKAINAQFLRDELMKRTYTRVFGYRDGSNKTITPLKRVSFGGGTWFGESTYTHKVSVKAYAKYRVVNEAGVMNRFNDFGAFDVPLTLWEVVPFSFVIDWFAPIGTWLGALTPKVGVEVIDSGVTVASQKEVVRVLTGYTPDGYSAGQWPDPPFPLMASDSFKAEGRFRTIGLPIPLFPPSEVNLNLKRLVDAVALLQSVRR